MSTPSSEEPASLQNPLSLLQETMVNLGHSSLAQNPNPDKTNGLTKIEWSQIICQMHSYSRNKNMIILLTGMLNGQSTQKCHYYWHPLLTFSKLFTLFCSRSLAECPNFLFFQWNESREPGTVMCQQAHKSAIQEIHIV